MGSSFGWFAAIAACSYVCFGGLGCVETAAPRSQSPDADRDAASLLSAASFGPEKPTSGAAFMSGGAGATSSEASSSERGQGNAGTLGAANRPSAAKSADLGAGSAAADGGSVNASDAAHPSPVTAADSGERSAAMPAQPGALVISELMVDPKALTDAEGEWFEIYNPGSEPLDLAGCSIADGSAQRHAITVHVTIPSHAFASVARADQPGFKPDVVTTFSLKNSADALEISCGSVAIDRVDYDQGRDFPLAAGAAMSLDSNSLDAARNDGADAWCLAVEAYATDFGSPGRSNPPCRVEDDAGIAADGGNSAFDAAQHDP